MDKVYIWDFAAVHIYIQQDIKRDIYFIAILYKINIGQFVKNLGDTVAIAINCYKPKQTVRKFMIRNKN